MLFDSFVLNGSKVKNVELLKRFINPFSAAPTAYKHFTGGFGLYNGKALIVSGEDDTHGSTEVFTKIDGGSSEWSVVSTDPSYEFKTLLLRCRNKFVKSSCNI